MGEIWYQIGLPHYTTLKGHNSYLAPPRAVQCVDCVALQGSPSRDDMKIHFFLTFYTMFDPTNCLKTICLLFGK